MPRPSHVRNAIRDLIAASSRHDWSIDDVRAALAELSVAADPSSVFRGLTYLEQVGAIRRVDLGDGKMRYEARRDHHDHVQCERCGAVAAVPGCTVGGCEAGIEAVTGYVVTGHRLLFSGLCRACLQGGQR